MLTINYKGKTYKPTDAWHFSVQAIVNDLIEKDCLEEVKENKELTDKCDIEDKTLHATDTNVTHSILEKLREWVSTELKLDGYEHQQILDKIDLLTSLETPQFTPGQEIDHDQVKENIRVMDEQDGYKIEPELPDYKANRIAPDGRHTLAHPNKLEIQVEDLNTFCQTLARQKPTK